jgi:hypothetical protein
MRGIRFVRLAEEAERSGIGIQQCAVVKAHAVAQLERV